MIAGATAGVSTVGDASISLIDGQISFEREKKSSLEARGLAVITTSGTLVTLLLALAAVITRTHGLAPSLVPQVLLLGALLAFLAAASLAIYCNAPLQMREVDAASLRSLTTRDVWNGVGDEARREIAIARLESLIVIQGVNEIKARMLLFATGSEVVAIVLTGLAAAVILVRG